MDLSEVYTGFHIWKDLDLRSIVAKEGAEEIERKIHTNHASCNFFCHFFCKGVKFGSCRIAGYGNICISLEGFDVGGACALGLQAND